MDCKECHVKVGDYESCEICASLCIMCVAVWYSRSSLSISMQSSVGVQCAALSFSREIFTLHRRWIKICATEHIAYESWSQSWFLGQFELTNDGIGDTKRCRKAAHCVLEMKHVGQTAFHALGKPLRKVGVSVLQVCCSSDVPCRLGKTVRYYITTQPLATISTLHAQSTEIYVLALCWSGELHVLG